MRRATFMGNSRARSGPNTPQGVSSHPVGLSGLRNPAVERDDLNGQYLAHLLACSFEVSSVPKTVHPVKGIAQSIGTPANAFSDSTEQRSGSPDTRERRFHLGLRKSDFPAGAPKDGQDVSFGVF